MMEAQGPQVDEQSGPGSSEVLRRSLENMISNVDVMEERICRTLQRFRDDLLRMQSTL